MKKAFTLAEIMIVLMVIGILTAILLPSARNAMPNEDVLKFKKAHNNFSVVIRELATSDKYFKDGDLATPANGSALTYNYLCNTIADIISVKAVSCDGNYTVSGCTYVHTSSGLTDTIKNKLDSCCNTAQTNAPQITTIDDIILFEADQKTTFATEANSKRIFASPTEVDPQYKDDAGFDGAYKIYCIDIDKKSSGQAPFGYGIRADGTMILGSRAQEWINKEIQDKD